MIDSHCHLEQPQFFGDLDTVIERCKKAGIKALISSCPDPRDFQRSLDILKQHKGYVFLAAGLHPEYIKDFQQKDIDEFFSILRENRDKLIAVGEVGLDYFWVKEEEWRAKQKELFIQFIELAEELKLPLMVHSRDSYPDIVKILEAEDVRRAHLHLWGGKDEMEDVKRNGWHISVGPIIATSKTHRKIVKSIGMGKIMLETDSPWFGERTPEGKRLRGEPTNIKIPAEKIAQELNLSFEEVWKKCGKNAINFYNLPK